MDFLEFFVVFVSGIAFAWVFNWFVNKRALSLLRQQYTQKAAATKQEYQDDLMSLLAEVKQAHDEWKEAGGTENADFAKKHLVGIAVRHPKTLARYGKRLYDLFKSGDFSSFEGVVNE